MIELKIEGLDSVIKQISDAFNLQSSAGAVLIEHKLLETLKENTPVATGNAQKNWKIEGSAIINRTEYLSNLNAGSSKQAPAFFIERAVLNTPGVKPNGTVVTYSEGA
jgi:hypothetical protein